MERVEPPETEVAPRVLRRILVRSVITVVAVGGMLWIADLQPFYAAMIRGAAIPVGIFLLWWTWRAIRSGRDRRAAERRQQARREGRSAG